MLQQIETETYYQNSIPWIVDASAQGIVSESDEEYIVSGKEFKIAIIPVDTIDFYTRSGLECLCLRCGYKKVPLSVMLELAQILVADALSEASYVTRGFSQIVGFHEGDGPLLAFTRKQQGSDWAFSNEKMIVSCFIPTEMPSDLLPESFLGKLKTAMVFLLEG